MKYFIMFFITIILALVIMFYKPYLDVYKNNVTIEYDFNDEDYSWSYETNNDNLLIEDESDNKWTFKPNKNGIVELTYYYKNEEDDNYKYKIYYKFRVLFNRIFWLEGEANGLFFYPNPY